MKRLSSILAMFLACLALLNACKDDSRTISKGSPHKRAMNESFVAQLDANGYFKSLASEKSQALKKDFYEQGWMAIFSDSHRFHHADAEDLAEGGICAFIREVEPFLTAQGVRLPELRDETSEKGYVVRVGGVAHKIYDTDDLRRDSDGKEPGLIWGLAMVRGFAIVDRLLEAAGSPERLYAVNGGNDLSAFFLTPELHRIISKHPDAVLTDGPYKPAENHPWFGQPHE